MTEPIHVYWARLLLWHILYDNGITGYKHTTGPVYWGPYSNQSNYVSITDCSGFVNALLQHSYNLDKFWAGVNRPYASTYYRMINEGKDFIKIEYIKNAVVGDFIVFRIPPGTSKSDNTGHIMMINELPKQINSLSIVNGTLQWSVGIIDQSGAHGKNDSRANGTDRTNGLGKGYFKIYTNRKGYLVGYSWSVEAGSKFISNAIRPIVIGRFVPPKN